MKFLFLIFSALRHKPVRTGLTLLSTMAAFLLLGVMQTIGFALSHPSPAFGSDLFVVTNKASLGVPLPYSYLADIQATPGVAQVSTEDTIGTYYRDPNNAVYAEVMDPAAYFAMNRAHLTITDSELKAMGDTRTGAIVGPALAEKYGWKAGDLVTLRTNGNYIQKDGSVDWTFKVVGIAKMGSPDDLREYGERFLVQYAYVDEARALNKGRVGMFTFQPQASADAQQVAQAIDAHFANSSFETRTQPVRDFLTMLIKQMGDVGFVINAISAAVLVTLAFMTANAMMHTFHERIPEFAVLKSIGFSDRLVASLIIGESVLSCALGACAGIGAACLLLPLLKKTINRGDLSPTALLPALAIALVLAIVVGLIPAWRAQRLQIVDALAGRH